MNCAIVRKQTIARVHATLLARPLSTAITKFSFECAATFQRSNGPTENSALAILQVAEIERDERFYKVVQKCVRPD
jgi:hypothetical protein